MTDDFCTIKYAAAYGVAKLTEKKFDFLAAFTMGDSIFSSSHLWQA